MNFARLVPALFLSVAQSLGAQSVSLPTGSPQVQACYLAAERTSTATVPLGALEPCVEALASPLNERERLATQVNLALIEVQLGDFDEAMKNYDLALTSSNLYVEVYLNRGNLFYLKGDFAAAIRDYSEALRLDSTVAELVHLNRGMAYQSRGEYILAESDYRAALSIRPEWPLPAEKLQLLEIERQTNRAP